jgi:hypothetical protein
VFWGCIYYEVVPPTLGWRPFERALAIAMLVLVPLDAIYAVGGFANGDLGLGLLELTAAIVGIGLLVVLAREEIADRRSESVDATSGAQDG